MTRSEILDNAKDIVNGERERQYGTPEKNFAEIAVLWTAYLDHIVTSKDVCCMMIMLKMARIKTGQGKDDNWIDIAGYAACGGEINESRKEDG